MNTTAFFQVLKKVNNNITLEHMFDYGVNKTERFFEILIHNEPSEKIMALCLENGFSVKKNRNNVRGKNGELVERDVWEVMPIDSNNIQYVSDETMVNVNENVIIATDNAMIEAGLVECSAKNELTLWTYERNNTINRMQWTPIMRVFQEPLMSPIKDEQGNVIEPKSTHQIDIFYGAPVNGRLDLRRYLESRGVKVVEIEKA